MIEFREITEDNFYDVINLEVSTNQQEARFVANNVKSLAEAWLYRDAGDVFPYAIYNQDELVGFILIDVDVEEREYMIWRMMIDKNHQGKGYGQKVVEKVIEIAQGRNDMDIVIANYVVGNDAMKRIVTRLGFKETGYDEDDREYHMKFDVKSK